MTAVLSFVAPAVVLAIALVFVLRASRRAAPDVAALIAPEPSAVLDSAADAILAIDDDSRIVYANPATLALFGFTPAELMGRALTALMPEGLRELHRDSMRRYMQTGARHLQWERVEFPAVRKNGEVFAVEIAFSEQRPQPAAGRVFVGVARDVTERRRTMDLMKLRTAVSEALAADAPATEAAPRLIRAVCDNAGWEAGELWNVDEAAGVLRLDTVWSGAPSIASALLTDARRLVLQPGNGLPGRAWTGGRTIWTTDALDESEFRRGDAARRCGLHGAYGLPLRARGRVVGVLALYTRRAAQPDRVLLDALDGLSAPIGEGIQRMRSDAQLREHAAQLRVLADISLEMAEVHPDLQLTMETAVRNTAERVGDLCLGLTLAEDGERFQLLAFHHRRPNAVMLVDELKGAAARLLHDSPAGGVVRSGRPLFIPVVTPEQMRPLVQDDYWPVVQRVGMHSLIVAPLKARGRLVGALLAARDADALPYSEDDLVFIQQLAGRAALGVASAHECGRPAEARPLGIRILAS